MERFRAPGLSPRLALLGRLRISPQSAVEFFFNYDKGPHEEELWTSDGTSSGTLLVKDFFPASSGAGPFDLTNFDGTLFFSADDGAHGDELWKSDGTAAGTVMVKDIDPGSTGSFPSDLTNVNGTLYFAANDGADGQELWKSDGTAAGTVMVKDIGPGLYSSAPDFSDERQRHALLHRRRRPRYRGTMEVGRGRRRNGDGQGHRPWPQCLLRR